jgi:hypothetical protein
MAEGSRGRIKDTLRYEKVRRRSAKLIRNARKSARKSHTRIVKVNVRLRKGGGEEQTKHAARCERFFYKSQSEDTTFMHSATPERKCASQHGRADRVRGQRERKRGGGGLHHRSVKHAHIT